MQLENFDNEDDIILKYSKSLITIIIINTITNF